MQDLFFAPEELEELEVRLGPIADDAPGRGAEDVLTPPRPVCKQAEAPVSTGGDCDFPQATPSDAIHEVGQRALYSSPEDLKAMPPVRQAMWGKHRCRT